MTSSESLGAKVRALRKLRNMSLDQLSGLSGISKASLSKVENGKMSLTFAKLQQLSHGLNVGVSELFHEDGQAPSVQPSGRARRSVARSDVPSSFSTHHYTYTYLHTDLLRRTMTPFRMVLRSRTMRDFGELIRHPGEEFIVVLDGSVVVHTEHYAPTQLGPGDSLYIDSTMGHAYLSVGDRDATIICVCAGEDHDSLPDAGHSPALGPSD